MHLLIQDCWAFGEAEKGQLGLKPKTHFLENISEAKTLQVPSSEKYKQMINSPRCNTLRF